MAGAAPKARANLQVNSVEHPEARQARMTATETKDPTPCMLNTPAMRVPLRAAEEDSEVTVAAKGYSPPTPAPRKNLQQAIWL